ncbi:MAG TPA: GFA family protein [Polyangiaceae bacterium]|nr:GFA family protein [Polyangiaceae bacterium]
MTTTTLQCLCGAITMELSGEPLACFYCHCDDCQAVHGAAYLPAAMYWTAQTRIVAGEPLRWKRRTTTRATCGACGTRLFAEPAGFEIRSISALLLPAGSFRPTFHVQCQHALLPVQDDLPHYKGFPAMFGGSDERMPW